MKVGNGNTYSDMNKPGIGWICDMLVSFRDSISRFVYLSSLMDELKVIVRKEETL